MSCLHQINYTAYLINQNVLVTKTLTIIYLIILLEKMHLLGHINWSKVTVKKVTNKLQFKISSNRKIFKVL